MPRTARASRGDLIYHVINRGNDRRTVFHSDDDYADFVRLLGRAHERHPVRVLSYCLMPNHFHLCLWPYEDGDLGRFMHWLSTAHVARYRIAHEGSGHIWQGRFKAFVAQSGGHVLRVLRYIERNPVRAGLARAAEDWPWSSAKLWRNGGCPSEAKPNVRTVPISRVGNASGGQSPFSVVVSDKGVLDGKGDSPLFGNGPKRGQSPAQTSGPFSLSFPWFHTGPVKRPANWLEFLRIPEPDEDLWSLRQCVNRGTPFGEKAWVAKTATNLGLESTIRPRGRPSESEGQKRL